LVTSVFMPRPPGTAPERSREITFATHHRRRRITGKFGLREAAEAEHLVDDEAGGHFPVIYNNDAHVARIRRDARAQVLPQIEDRQQLAAHVRDALHPGLGAGHAREARGHREYLARLFARGEIQLARHAKRDTHPLARTRVLGCRRGGDRATASLELCEELEGPVAQAL
jgi:hypothetical protein